MRVELVPPAKGLRDPTLVVLVRTDDTPAAEGGGPAFEPCFAVPQASPLPPGDYFLGLSAWNDKAGGARALWPPPRPAPEAALTARACMVQTRWTSCRCKLSRTRRRGTP